MKRMLDWKVNNEFLIMSEYKGKDEPNEELERFDISIIYPDFVSMNEVQKFIIEYGLKQKLADGGSANVGDVAGKVEVAKEKFKMFVEGKLTGVRLNATGAKENKKIANVARDTAKIISLDGLRIKKLLFADTFTEEDQEKLNEFEEMVAESKK